MHSVFDWHARHDPPEQNGALVGQSVFDTHCTHEWVVVSQIGVEPLQVVFDVHDGTHVLLAEQESPLGQLDDVRHCTHWPAGSQ